jgi:hypothetical protein
MSNRIISGDLKEGAQMEESVLDSSPNITELDISYDDLDNEEISIWMASLLSTSVPTGSVQKESLCSVHSLVSRNSI